MNRLAVVTRCRFAAVLPEKISQLRGTGTSAGAAGRFMNLDGRISVHLQDAPEN